MLQPLHLGKPKLLLIQAQETLPAETSLYLFPVSLSICQRPGGRVKSPLQKLILAILILPKIKHEKVNGSHVFYQSPILAFTSFCTPMNVSQLPKPHVLPLLFRRFSAIAPMLPLSATYVLPVSTASVSYLSTCPVIIMPFPPTALRFLQQTITYSAKLVHTAVGWGVQKGRKRKAVVVWGKRRMTEGDSWKEWDWLRYLKI